MTIAPSVLATKTARPFRTGRRPRMYHQQKELRSPARLLFYYICGILQGAAVIRTMERTEKAPLISEKVPEKRIAASCCACKGMMEQEMPLPPGWREGRLPSMRQPPDCMIASFTDRSGVTAGRWFMRCQPCRYSSGLSNASCTRRKSSERCHPSQTAWFTVAATGSRYSSSYFPMAMMGAK